MSTTKKIAIVYDWIDSWGGVERVILRFHELFPSAEFYTSFYDAKKAPWAKKLTIRTSFMQKLPHFIRANRVLSLIFFPLAFESFDFSSYDLVISISSAFSKSVITKPGTTHVCYVLTPPRYLWGMTNDYVKNSLAHFVAMPMLRSLRYFDYLSAQRPDTIVSISQTVAKRCKKYYGRGSIVISPPLDMQYWNTFKKERHHDKKYYLVVSRLELYKKVDLVIDTFNKRNDHLIVVGRGTQKNRLRKKAGKNITFLENIADEELAVLYTHAQALIMPQEEDFGYVSLEAQLFGCPIIAYRSGGATETVDEGKTGIFFDKQTVKSLEEALARSRPVAYNGRHTFGQEQFDAYFKKLSEMDKTITH